MQNRIKHIVFIVVLASVAGLPLMIRRDQVLSDWRSGDPVLVIISPHNEAIRNEFGRAFSAWHKLNYGHPVRIDWRVLGGTSDIMRYLEGAFQQSFRAYWTAQGGEWPSDGSDMLLDPRYRSDGTAGGARAEAERGRLQYAIRTAFQETDDPAAFSCGIDLLFGGGTYDHGVIARKGLTVAPWPEGNVPEGLFKNRSGYELIPEVVAGEVWRSAVFFGCCLSTFGICYNPDRINDLGLDPPAVWADLADIRYAGLLGVADPTKSGSIAKAFEMMIHQQCHLAVNAAGFSVDECRRFERALAEKDTKVAIPEEYDAAIRRGWRNGLFLVQKIGANARYFTEGAGQVPVDVSMGNAAAGIAIDFYGRFQAEFSRLQNGFSTLEYITPAGGSSVSADPVSLLRGAPERELAVRFIDFVLSEDGQRLWVYRPGTPGGPERYALRRLPIRRDFYPGSWPGEAARRHLQYCADQLDDPQVDPYAIAASFEYFPRWTGAHFAVQRDLIRAMCIDSGPELRALWAAVAVAGGPEICSEVIEYIEKLPEVPVPLTWESARTITHEYERIDYMNIWTQFFRQRYREGLELLRRR